MPRISRYNKALALVEAARLAEGCGCRACQEDRAKDVMPKAQKLVNPTLPFLPLKFRDAPYLQVLEALNDIYTTNAKIGRRKGWFNFCQACGLLHPAEESTSDKKGNHCCTSCTKTFMTICKDCGAMEYKYVDLYSVMYSVPMKGKKVTLCRTCYSKYESCKNCKEISLEGTLSKYLSHYDQPNDKMVYYKVCNKCEEELKVSCHSCGENTLSILCNRDRGGKTNKNLCRSCYEEEIGLHPFTFKPTRLNFQTHSLEGKVTKKGFHMGFELESAQYESFIERTSMTHLVKELFGKKRFYCVRDGTIQRESGFDGMEIVTHPFTWQMYRKELSYLYDDLILFLRNKGWKSNLKGIGFHVHTTKAAWGSHQIYKLLKLIYGNKAFVKKIAQRPPNTYCVMNSEDFNEAALVAKDKKNRNPDHYGTINLNSNNGKSSASTIEFRMFQGTLEPLYFHKNLEFVYACYQYTGRSSDMTKKGFLRYITYNKAAYPCLNEFIRMKGIR